jgi:hypothetical protein
MAAETKDRPPRTPYEAYWDGWNDACDAIAQMSLWKRAIIELKHKFRLTSAMSGKTK